MLRFLFRLPTAPPLLALLMAAGCSGSGGPASPVQPTPVPVVAPTPPPPPNTPPRISALTVSTDRVEVGEEVTLTATVVDDETAADQLTYQWTAAAGTITGTGRTVKWRAPVGGPTPSAYTISLTVIDKSGAGEQALEHRVTAETSKIYVDDSPKAVRALSEEFIRDFADSSISPEACVRNFSDSCRGKRAELEDVTNNRRYYLILSHKFTVSSVTINASRTQSTVSGPCEFRSIYKPTNALEVATGICELTLINEGYRWWLCDSRMRGANSVGLRFFF